MSIGNSPGNSPEDDRPSITEDDRPSVGRALQQARIDAGLTVEDVSAATRVRVPIVHAIEQDDFSRCGGDVYARGHIRTVARSIGIDPAPLIEQYDDAHGGRPTPTDPTAPLFEAERIRPDARRPNWTAAMVAAIVAVIGFVGFTLFSGADESGSKTPVAEGSKPSVEPETKPSPSKPADQKPDPEDSAIAGAPKDKVTVMVSADDGRSWISAKDHNGRIMFDGLLKQGQSKSFTDKEKIDLVLGDAGAIKLFVNGKEIPDEFEPGTVERLSYTKGDNGGDPGAG